MSLFRTIKLILISILLTACITLPGHRHIINEDNFYLKVSAPNKAIRSNILFNQDKTRLEYLPETARIELKVKDDNGNHDLTIKNSKGIIVYQYYLNNQRQAFGHDQQEWFATHIPEIIERTGINFGRQPERNRKNSTY